MAARASGCIRCFAFELQGRLLHHHSIPSPLKQTWTNAPPWVCTRGRMRGGGPGKEGGADPASVCPWNRDPSPSPPCVHAPDEHTWGQGRNAARRAFLGRGRDRERHARSSSRYRSSHEFRSHLAPWLNRAAQPPTVYFSFHEVLPTKSSAKDANGKGKKNLLSASKLTWSESLDEPVGPFLLALWFGTSGFGTVKGWIKSLRGC